MSEKKTEKRPVDSEGFVLFSKKPKKTLEQLGIDYKNKEIELGKKIHDMLENKFCDAVAQLIEEKNFVPKTLIKIPIADFFGYNNGDKIKRFIIKFVEYQRHILIYSSVSVIENNVEWSIEFI